MKPLITGPSSAPRCRLTIGTLLTLVALGFSGCEQALQTAPTSSVLTLTSPANAVDLNNSMSITATVTSSNGRAVDDGTLVTFTTTLGRVEPNEARVANGRATVQLIAGSVAGVASISASSGAVAASPLPIRVGPVPARIMLAHSSGALGATNIVATVFDAQGIAVPLIPVTFTASVGTLASSSVYTDQLGQAFTTLYSVAESVVTADSLGVTSTIAVRPGASGTIGVNVTMAPAAPKRNQTVVFTASVAAAGGVSIPIERYEWDWGGGYVVVTTGNTTSRTFSTEGTYAVTVRVVSADGSAGTSRVEFYVD